MGIDIGTYRVRIELHNYYKLRSTGSLHSSGKITGKLYDIFDIFLHHYIPAVGLCIKYILLFICMFSFIFDIAVNHKRDSFTTTKLVETLHVHNFLHLW